MPEIEVNGIELNYQVSGRGQPILFIHGLGSSGRDWEPQVDYFAKQYQAVTYDVRGHGKSGKPRGPYSIPLFAADAAALIEALDIAPAHLVGISMGGMIAFQLAVSSAGLARSLAIVNSAPALLVQTPRERLQLLQRLLIVRLLGMRKMGRCSARGCFLRWSTPLYRSGSPGVGPRMTRGHTWTPCGPW